MAKKPDLTIVKDDANAIKPPRKLGKHGTTLWHAIQNEYSITDRGGIEVLAQICAMADRAEALAECVARDGETIRTKTGLRAHPALREELGARAFICAHRAVAWANFVAVGSRGYCTKGNQALPSRTIETRRTPRFKLLSIDKGNTSSPRSRSLI